jgi:hypothetical protein
MRSRKEFGVHPRTGTSLLIAMVFMTMNMCSFAQESNTDAAQLMREVIRNELQSQNQDQSHWRYRQVREVDGKKELRDVYQTKCGDIYRVLAINDGLLNPKQAAAERRRLQRLLSDPDRMRERQEEQQADAEKARKVLNMLPSAFLYKYEGMEGHLIRLEFAPNQEFHPTDRAGEVFHHLTGSVLIDGQSKHLAEISGRLIADVKFGGGLLGHLEKGGTFVVVRKDVGFGHWQLAVIDIQMNGKAMLFKTLSIQQKESYSNYSLLPDDMTLEQVAGALVEETGEADEAALK